jgi:RHS repeat-associated protein
MLRTSRNLILLLAVVLGVGGQTLAMTTATITVNGAEQPGDTNAITISFNGFIETAHYGQFSTPASIASTFGAKFSNDYLPLGLCAHATGNVITFQLRGAATFGTVDITGSTTSFQMSALGFLSTVSKIVDTGTITLTINGVLAATANYGYGATPSSVAEGLAAAASDSQVKVTAVNDSIYIQAAGTGAGTNYSYSLQTTAYDSTDFGQPSFLSAPISGNLDGGASATTGQTPQTVYSYTSSYDGVSNVTGNADTVMGTWSFSNGYDTLNRLIAGTATSGTYAGQNLCWSYDSFGNRTAQSMQTSACPSSPSTLTATAAYNGNNRITWTSVKAAGNNISYDGAGNVTNDGVNTYLNDIDGRICAVKSEPVAGIYTMTGYLYDAEGRRIAKGSITNMNSCDPAVNGFQSSTEHDYILGLSGEQVTEMAMDSNNSMAWQHTNVWVGSKPLATYDSDGLHFYLNDQLGTRRVQTDYAGVPEQTCSSLPFGDSLSCTSSALYPTEHNFVGKERDTESGNDYFGARYYSSSVGRWMSPDLPFADQDPDDPQSWNLFSYGRNNPINSIDNDGLLTIIVPGTWWESSGGWGPDNALFGYANSALRGACTQDCTKFLAWKPSGNNDHDRIQAAQWLRHMVAAHKFAPGEKLNIITHSHGGNVALAASHLGLTHRIDTLITLNKPTLNGDAYKPGNNIGNFFNMSVSADSTQMYGSNAWHFATDNNATNVTFVGLHDDNPHAALIWNTTGLGSWVSWLNSNFPNDTPAPPGITITVYPDGSQTCSGCANRVQ